MALQFNLAIRDYVAAEIRPRMESKIGKDEFIPEAMSTSFVSRSIFEAVRKKFPGMIIRFASDKPRNPVNAASPDELRMIEFFRMNPQVHQKTEEIEIDGRQYMAFFSPKFMKQECLRCHGDPKDAPTALIERYGATASFHRKVGDVAALDTVAAPLDQANAASISNMRRQLVVLVAGLAVLFGSVLAVFRLVVTRRLTAMVRHFRDGASRADSVCTMPAALAGRDEISVLQAAWEAIRESEEKFRSITSAAQDAVIMMDDRGVISFWNQAASRMFGYSGQEAVGKNLHSLVSPDRYRRPHQAVSTQSSAIVHGQAAGATIELEALRKGGAEFPVEMSVSPVRLGDRWHSVGIIRDITERKRLEEELRAAARTDKLTGLPNRALLCDRLRQAILRAKRLPNYHFAVLFLDFDRFKIINDSLGHEIGDRLLQEISVRLRRTVRSGDSLSRDVREHTSARLGGDEFVVLLDGIDSPADAGAVAGRLLEAFAGSYLVGEHEMYCTASIGIVTSDIAADTAEDVLRDADTAMYEAKLAGRGRHVVFDASMRQRVQNRLDLENDLRRAVEEGQLFLMYQPIVSLETGRIESFEALLRWRHPQRGLISPAEFVPVAEDTGLIVPIGEWVLREACRQCVRWHRDHADAGKPSISVNLSRNQLLLPGLPDTVRQILASTGLPASSLHLEITESAVMVDADLAVRVLHDIKRIGVKLDLDDFGTGYSSLSCLHQFPLDVLKIDRSFVANIERGRDFAALINAVAALARNLGISVVAEGIETVEQLAVLQTLDCDFGQGYYFAKAMTGEQAGTFRLEASMLPGDPAGMSGTGQVLDKRSDALTPACQPES